MAGDPSQHSGSEAEPRLGLIWDAPQEKEAALQELATRWPVLRRDPSLDVDSDTPGQDHVLIEGDNLWALALLAATHTEAVDFIYIDPPYNTGKKDFRYNDHWVVETDSWRHSTWLEFMNLRLTLAYDLLKPGGMIAISIDDNEIHRLRMLCDQVFGEKNYVTTLIWEKKYTVASDARHVANRHEYVLVYARDERQAKTGLLPRTEKQNRAYKQFDDDPRGPFKPTPIHARSGKPESIYTITFPNGVTWTPPEGSYPRYTRERLMEMYEDNRLYFGKTGRGVPQKKLFLSEVTQGVKMGSILDWKTFGTTQTGSDELKAMVGWGKFDYPKPSRLIKELVRVFAPEDGLVCDFFAGTGTTTQAVAALNAEDGGSRRSIAVTNNEGDICRDVTHPRIRAALTGDWSDNPQAPALGGRLIGYTVDLADLPREPTAGQQAKVQSCGELAALAEWKFDQAKVQVSYETAARFVDAIETAVEKAFAAGAR